MYTDKQRPGFVIVLDRPQDAVNIGTVVRALKNMGFMRLRLVQPRAYDEADLQRVAHHAEDVIEQIQVYATLEEALADTIYVVGTSAIAHRGHALRKDVEALSKELVQRSATGLVALLFGTEDDGLGLEALDRCHCIVTLPTNPEYPALNLAQSVLLLLYELSRQTRQEAAAIGSTASLEPPLEQRTLEQLFARVEEALTDIAFFKYDPPAVMRTLRGIVYRAELRSDEVALLLAIARRISYAAAHPRQTGADRQKE